MRGWERVGVVRRVTGDFDLWLDDAHAIQRGDLLRFSASYPGASLRSGQVQVKGLLADGVVTDECARHVVVALCDGDHVYRATALGEDAFKRGDR